MTQADFISLSEERLDQLVEVGKTKGSLSQDELLPMIENVELSPDVIDQLLERLRQKGVAVDTDGEIDAEVDILINASRPPSGFSGTVTDPIRTYLQAIGSIELLTADEEKRLAEINVKGQRAAAKLLEAARSTTTASSSSSSQELENLRTSVARGLEARKRLVEANLRLVVSIAKRYRHRGISFLDLIQEGNAGLVRAVEKFDPERGFRVSTYATWWIRQAIGRSVADQARTIRIPVHVYETLSQLLRVQRSMLQQLGREPSIEEIAERVKLPVKRVQDVLTLNQSTISIEPVGDEPGLSDIIPDEKFEQPAAVVDRSVLANVLREAIETLNEREQKLMELRFGLNDGSVHSLSEVAASFGVSRERVRQIETKTLSKLRTPLEQKRIEDFLSE